MEDNRRYKVSIVTPDGQKAEKEYSAQDFQNKNVGQWLDDNYAGQYNIEESSPMRANDAIDAAGTYRVTVSDGADSMTKDYDGATFHANQSRFRELNPNASIDVQRVRSVNNWQDLFNQQDDVDPERARLNEINQKMAELAQDENMGRKEKKNALAELSNERMQNKAYLSDLSDLNRDIESIDTNLAKMKEENPTAYNAYLSVNRAGRMGAQGAPMAMAGIFSGKLDKDFNSRLENLMASRAMLDDARKIAETPSHYGDQNAIANMWKGLTGNMPDNFTPTRLMRAGLNVGLIEAIRKVQDNNEGSATNIVAALEGNTPYLTNEEKSLLNAFIRKSDMEATRSTDMSWGYNAGKSFGQSIGFMMDFALAGGAADAIAEKAMGDIVEKASGNLLTKTVAAIGQNLVKTAVMTPMMGSSYASLMDNLLQLDDDQSVDLTAKNILKQVGDVFIENYTENAGDNIVDFGGGLLNKAGIDFAKMPWNRQGTMLYGMAHSVLGSQLKQAGFHGFLGEMSEEVYGSLLRTLTGVDKDAWNQFWTGENLLTTVASFAPLTLFGMGTGAVQHGYIRNNYNKASDAFLGMANDENDRNILQSAMNSALEAETPEEMGSVLREGIMNSDISGIKPDFGKVAAEYAKWASLYKVASGYQAEDLKGKVASLKEDFDSAYNTTGDNGNEHRWYFADENGNDVVRVITDRDGNTYFGVQSENKDFLAPVVVSEDGEGFVDNPIPVLDNGKVRFLDPSTVSEDVTMPISTYLGNMVGSQEQIEDEERMAEEGQTKIDEIRRKAVIGATFDMGTDTAPDQAQIMDIQPGDVYIVQTAEGVQQMSLEEVGRAMGISTNVMTHDEMVEAEAAEYARKKGMQDSLNADGGFAFKYNGADLTFVRAIGVPYEQDGQQVINAMVIGTTEDGDMGETQVIPVPVGVLQSQKAVADAYEDNGDDEETVQETDALTMSDGSPLPMRTKRNGERVVDEKTLYNNDLEAYARYSDATYGEEETRRFLTDKQKALAKEVSDIDKAIAKEKAGKWDDNLIDDYTDTRNQANARLRRITDVLNAYAQADAVAAERAKAEQERIKREEASRERELNEPQSLRQVVANWFKQDLRGKLNRESFKKETGKSNEEMAKFFMWFAKKGQGMTIDAIAESIMADDDTGLLPMAGEVDQYDAQAIKNEVIEVLRTASVPSDITGMTYAENAEYQRQLEEYYAEYGEEEAPMVEEPVVETSAEPETPKTEEPNTEREATISQSDIADLYDNRGEYPKSAHKKELLELTMYADTRIYADSNGAAEQELINAAEQYKGEPYADAILSRVKYSEVAETPAEKPKVEQKPKKPVRNAKKVEVKANTLVTEERHEELVRRLKAKLGQLNSGYDPEMFALGAELAMYHIEKGARTFSAYAKAVIAEVGENARQYLKSWYNGARDLPGMEEYAKEMDSYEVVLNTDVKSISTEAEEVAGDEVINNDVENSVITADFILNSTKFGTLFRNENGDEVQILTDGSITGSTMIWETPNGGKRTEKAGSPSYVAEYLNENGYSLVPGTERETPRNEEKSAPVTEADIVEGNIFFNGNRYIRIGFVFGENADDLTNNLVEYDWKIKGEKRKLYDRQHSNESKASVVKMLNDEGYTLMTKLDDEAKELDEFQRNYWENKRKAEEKKLKKAAKKKADFEEAESDLFNYGDNGDNGDEIQEEIVDEFDDVVEEGEEEGDTDLFGGAVKQKKAATGKKAATAKKKKVVEPADRKLNPLPAPYDNDHEVTFIGTGGGTFSFGHISIYKDNGKYGYAVSVNPDETKHSAQQDYVPGEFKYASINDAFADAINTYKDRLADLKFEHPEYSYNDADDALEKFKDLYERRIKAETTKGLRTEAIDGYAWKRKYEQDFLDMAHGVEFNENYPEKIGNFYKSKPDEEQYRRSLWQAEEYMEYATRKDLDEAEELCKEGLKRKDATALQKRNWQTLLDMIKEERAERDKKNGKPSAKGTNDELSFSPDGSLALTYNTAEEVDKATAAYIKDLADKLMKAYGVKKAAESLTGEYGRGRYSSAKFYLDKKAKEYVDIVLRYEENGDGSFSQIDKALDVIYGFDGGENQHNDISPEASIEAIKSTIDHSKAVMAQAETEGEEYDEEFDDIEDEVVDEFEDEDGGDEPEPTKPKGGKKGKSETNKSKPAKSMKVDKDPLVLDLKKKLEGIAREHEEYNIRPDGEFRTVVNELLKSMAPTWEKGNNDKKAEARLDYIVKDLPENMLVFLARAWGRHGDYELDEKIYRNSGAGSRYMDLWPQQAAERELKRRGVDVEKVSERLHEFVASLDGKTPGYWDMDEINSIMYPLHYTTEGIHAHAFRMMHDLPNAVLEEIDEHGGRDIDGAAMDVLREPYVEKVRKDTIKALKDFGKKYEGKIPADDETRKAMQDLLDKDLQYIARNGGTQKYGSFPKYSRKYDAELKGEVGHALYGAGSYIYSILKEAPDNVIDFLVHDINCHREIIEFATIIAKKRGMEIPSRIAEPDSEQYITATNEFNGIEEWDEAKSAGREEYIAVFNRAGKWGARYDTTPYVEWIEKGTKSEAIKEAMKDLEERVGRDSSWESKEKKTEMKKLLNKLKYQVLPAALRDEGFYDSKSDMQPFEFGEETSLFGGDTKRTEKAKEKRKDNIKKAVKTGNAAKVVKAVEDELDIVPDLFNAELGEIIDEFHDRPVTEQSKENLVKAVEKVVGKDYDTPLASRKEVLDFLKSIGYKGTTSNVMESNGKKFIKYQANGVVTPNIFLGETTPEEIFRQFYLYGNVMDVDLPDALVQKFDAEKAESKAASKELWKAEEDGLKDWLNENGINFETVIDSERGLRIVFTADKNENGNYTNWMDVADLDDAKERKNEIEKKQPKATEAPSLTKQEYDELEKAYVKALKAYGDEVARQERENVDYMAVPMGVQKAFTSAYETLRSKSFGTEFANVDWRGLYQKAGYALDELLDYIDAYNRRKQEEKEKQKADTKFKVGDTVTYKGKSLKVEDVHVTDNGTRYDLLDETIPYLPVHAMGISESDLAAPGEKTDMDIYEALDKGIGVPMVDADGRTNTIMIVNGNTVYVSVDGNTVKMNAEDVADNIISGRWKDKKAVTGGVAEPETENPALKRNWQKIYVTDMGKEAYETALATAKENYKRPVGEREDYLEDMMHDAWYEPQVSQDYDDTRAWHDAVKDLTKRGIDWKTGNLLEAPEYKDLGETYGTIKKSKHTKTGEEIWVVNRESGSRLSKEEFDAMRKRAKLYGGYYSSFKSNKGFIFKSEEDANNFNNLKNNDNGNIERTDEQTAADSAAIVREAGSIGQEAEAVINGEEGNAEEVVKKIDETLEDIDAQLALLGYKGKGAETTKLVAAKLSADTGLEFLPVNINYPIVFAGYGEYVNSRRSDIEIEFKTFADDERSVTMSAGRGFKRDKYRSLENPTYAQLLNAVRELIPDYVEGGKPSLLDKAKEISESSRKSAEKEVTSQETDAVGNLFTAMENEEETETPAPVRAHDLTEYNGFSKGEKVLFRVKGRKDAIVTLVGFDDSVGDIRPVVDSFGASWITEVTDWENISKIDNGGNTPQNDNNDELSGRSTEENGRVGAEEPQEAERTERGGVAERDNLDSSSDEGRGERVAGSAPQSDVEKPLSDKEKKNTNNNHVGKGESFAPTTAAARFNANVEAIRTSRKIEDEGRIATKEEMAVLRQYTGWGGLGGVFDNEFGANYAVLKSLLSPEELDDAAGSVNSAYYTPVEVIDGLWEVAKKLGFKGGKVLEGSAGIGNILASMPKSMSERSDIMAVEKESLSGTILSQLYPDADVRISGFEEVKIDNGSVDLAITNVPFVQGLHVRDEIDKDLAKMFPSIHNYCIAKNVRKLKEGGIAILITTKGTLDNSEGAKLRKWVTGDGSADFIGAFRLNSDTFGDTGTKATSDILVIRKRTDGVKADEAIDVAETAIARTAEMQLSGRWDSRLMEYVPRSEEHDAIYNRYFIEHPENMGGEMAFAFEKNETFQPTTLRCYPAEGIDQSARLEKWAKSFGSMKKMQTKETVAPVSKEVKGEATTAKEGQIIIDSKGNICQSHFGKAVALGVNKNKVKGYEKKQVLADYDAIKKSLSEVLDYQSKNSDDKGLDPLLKTLNSAYDRFVKRYGPLNRNTSISFLRDDIDFATTAAIENYNEKEDRNGKKKVETSKTDIFRKRMIGFETEPTFDTAKDGVIASMNVHGRIDIPFIAGKLSMSEDDAKDQILKSGLAFEDPRTGTVEVKYRYLSGNVREKLAYAKEYNTDGRYDSNIKALEEVMPSFIPAHLINFSLGSDWVSPELYIEYAKEKFGVGIDPICLEGVWTVRETSFSRSEKNRSAGVHSDQVGKTVFGHELMRHAMNNTTPSFTKKVKTFSGEITINDTEATKAAGQKIEEMKDDFKDWANDRLQNDNELADKVANIYNELFNNYAPMNIGEEFLVSHLPGSNEDISLYPHQKAAVMRASTEPVLLAHEVGSGKTFTLISSAMEMKRLGTAKKPMIVVQNATTGQFVASAKLLYPNAKILTVAPSDRTAEGRAMFYAKIKYNEWDMIIVPQSVFEMIPDSEQRKRDFIQEKIDDKLTAMQKAKEMGLDSWALRDMQKDIDDLEYELAHGEPKPKKTSKKNVEKAKDNASVKAQEQLDRKVDNTDNFDDMGIDALLIDEAHAYKHLGFSTSIQRGVKGIDPSGSKRSAGVYLKLRSIFDRRGRRNVVFATGTPISNTAAEVWTFMKYLMDPQFMRDSHIYYFDDFLRNFGNVAKSLEFTTSGKFKENTRFASYVNVPELVRLWASVSDTVLTKDAVAASGTKLTDKIPSIEGGKAQDVFLPQSRTLVSIMKYVRDNLEKFEQMSGKEKKENSHIPLVMYGIAKRAAIDPRLVFAKSADEPMSKTNKTVEYIIEDLDKTKDYNGTVAVFCDNYRRLDVVNGKKVEGFNIFNEIKRKLVEKGVPEDQIVIMQSGMTDTKKEKIFSAVNAGDIRVILGSTQTLGTGVNIQTRLHMVVHMDAPDRPMDYTQRNGRILRQGNLHKEWNLPVRIVRFGVEDSLDVTSYQRLKTKAAFIDSVMDSKDLLIHNAEGRTLEEEEEGLFDNPVAVLSGSQYALKKTAAEREYRKYLTKKQQYEQDQIYVVNQLRRNEYSIKNNEETIDDARKDLEEMKKLFADGKAKTITVKGKKATDAEAVSALIREEINDPLKKAVESLRGTYSPEGVREENYTIDADGTKVNIKVVLTKRAGQYDPAAGRVGKSTISANVSYSVAGFNVDRRVLETKLDMRKVLDDFMKEVATGNYFSNIITSLTATNERLRSDNALMEERKGRPFADAKALEDAKALVDDLTEKMREELAEKEKKYADVQGDSEIADSLGIIDSDSIGEDGDFMIDDADYSSESEEVQAVMQMLAEAGVSANIVSNEEMEALRNDSATELEDSDFEIRTKPAPEKTGIGYKVFYRGKNGKLYPPMVANKGGVDTPVGVWLDAEEGERAADSKTGRPQVKQGGKGTQGGSGTLAYRPGWHLGEIPYALQFNRKDENGEKTLFPKDFVWAEVEYAMDVDYQDEAMAEGTNANGKFQHSLAGLKRLPEDGYYKYRTNPNPATDPWIITGAMKVNKVLTKEEVDDIVRKAGREPQRVELMSDSRGKVYGAVKDGVMYLNRDVMNTNTPVHEYTHLWDKAVQKSNPRLWKRGVELMKQTDEWQKVVDDPNYAGLAGNEDRIASEVHSRLSGRDGELLVSKVAKEDATILGSAKAASIVNRLRNWFNDFWKYVKDTFTPWSREEADAVSVEDFIRMPLADLARAKNPADASEDAEYVYDNGLRAKSSESTYDFVRRAMNGLTKPIRYPFVFQVNEGARRSAYATGEAFSSRGRYVIRLYANDLNRDGNEVERTIYHESFHNFVDIYGLDEELFRIINLVDYDGAIKTEVEETVDDNGRPAYADSAEEEVSARIFEQALHGGQAYFIADLIKSAGRDDLADKFDNILNDLGYDAEKERLRRTDEGSGSEETGKGGSGEQQKEKGVRGEAELQVVTPSEDRNYLDAVERGDMETASRMVADAAKKAMPNTKVVDEDGNPLIVYHGTGVKFNKFLKATRGTNTQALSAERGFFFTDNKRLADWFADTYTNSSEGFDYWFRSLKKMLKREITKEMADNFVEEVKFWEDDEDFSLGGKTKKQFTIDKIEDYILDGYFNSFEDFDGWLYKNVGLHAKVTIPVFLNIENPIVDEVARDYTTTDDTIIENGMTPVLRKAAKEGNDGVIYTSIKERGGEGNQYVIFEPSQAKSADIVTYDDKGKVIPLSQRFNKETDDIRFRPADSNLRSADPLSYSQSTGAKRHSVEDTARKAGIDISIVSRDEMPDGHSFAKGYWKNGECYVCLENHNDAEDAARTVLHEGVGHEGLRRLVGEENFRSFLKDVRARLSKEAQREIAQDAIRRGGRFDIATEEYLAKFAEGMDIDREVRRNVFDKLRSALRDLLAKVGINVRLTDRDLMWLMWQSRHANDQRTILNEAKRQSVANRLGFSLHAQEVSGILRNEMRLREDNVSLSAARLYNKDVINMWSRLHEVWVDKDDAVLSLKKAIEKTSTKGEAKPFEDVALALNQQSSRGLAAIEKWERKYWGPLAEIIKEITGATGLSVADVERYMMVKHGLERNEKLAKRDARDHYQGIYDAYVNKVNNQDNLDDEERKALIEKADKALQRHFDKIDDGSDTVYLTNRQNDYSGLISMYSRYDGDTEKDAVESDEEYNARMKAMRHPIYENLEQTEAAAMNDVEDFEQRTGRADELWERINAATKATLEIQYKGNIISRDTYKTVSEMFDYYVPLRGFKDKTAEDMYSYYTENYSNSFVPTILMAKGRRSEAASPLGFIGAQASSAVAQSEKNNTKLALYYFVSNRADNDIVTISDVWYERKTDPVTGDVAFEAVYPPLGQDLTSEGAKLFYQAWEDAMKEKAKRGEAFKRTNKLKLGKIVAHIDAKNEDSHIIKFKVGGRDMMMYINGNPRAAEAINNQLNIETSGDYQRFFGKVLRYFSGINTSYNPEFWISNLQRDLMFSMMSVSVKEDKEYNARFHENLRSNLGAWVGKNKSLRQLMKAYENDSLGDSDVEQYYREFVENGGVTGYTTLRSNDEWEQMIRKAAGEEKEAIRKIGDMFDKVAEFGEAFEQMTRFTAYLTSRQMGKEVKEAVADAKELTVNFNRKGSGKVVTLEEANKLRNNKNQPLSAVEKAIVIGLSYIPAYGRRFIMFFNAGVQGLNAMYQLAKTNGKSTATWLTAYAAAGALTAILHALIDDDDDYLDIPDYERRNNALLGANGVYFKWALPQEARGFYALGDFAVNWAMGREIDNSKAGTLFNMLADVAPINPSDGISSLVPSAVSPFIEVALNKDYKGSKVHPDNKYRSEEEKRTSPKYQEVFSSTGRFYVGLAQFLNSISGGDAYDSGFVNIYPDSVEHLVEGFTGGAGTTIEKFVKGIMSTAGGAIDAVTGLDTEKYLGTFSVRSTPFLSRLVTVNDERYRNAHVNDLYWYYRNEASHTDAVFKKAVKNSDTDKLDDLMNSGRYDRMNIYEAYEKSIDAYNDLLKLTDDQRERKELMAEQDELKKEMIYEISNLK